MKKILIISIFIAILVLAGYYFWNAKEEKIDPEEQKKWMEEYLKQEDQRKQDEQEQAAKLEKQKEIDETEEVTLNEEELKQYYAGYKDRSVLHIRKALNGYLAGTNEGMSFPDELDSFDKEYYKSKFALFSVDGSVGGGKLIQIIFQDKPDRVFLAWVYPMGDGTYDLRSFKESEEATKDIEVILKMYGKYMLDKEHGL